MTSVDHFARRWPHRVAAALLVAALFVLAACEDEEAEAESSTPPVRAIKYVVLSDTAAAQRRVLTGVVEASTITRLAFEIPGRVIDLPVVVGDALNEGTLVAQLDRAPYELQVQEARSRLRQVNAQLDDAEKKFAQQESLFERGIVSRTAFDSALAELETARADVGIVDSQLALALRDLTLTTLVAPFEGRVARTHIERFEEVSSGEAIVDLQDAAALEVVAALPETLINRVGIGQEMTLTFPSLGRIEALGRLVELSPVAEQGNAYPIKLAIAEPPSGLRPGMSAEVIVEYDTGATGTALTVPLTAVLPSIEGDGGTVFVFDADAGVVRARAVRSVALRDNVVAIEGDIASGDVVAVAGISFLYDGMPARLLGARELR
ncbi:MAG: efflux RND transporter periplasmic adaptor subunit [Pseudomonadota bacterium]